MPIFGFALRFELKFGVISVAFGRTALRLVVFVLKKRKGA